jgi:SET domain-containing protein
MRLEVRPSPGKGKGVYARQPFARGDVIETAPVLVVPAPEHVHLDKTTLYHYYFAWGPDPDAIALAMGYVSFVNHAYRPNARYVKDYGAEQITLVALRAIAAGEEVTVNYNGDPDDDAPLWFPVA